MSKTGGGGSASPDYFMTAGEAAAYLRVSKSTLAKLRVYGGGCPFTKVGSKVVYRVADLHAWMAGRLKRSTSDEQVSRADDIHG
jgi:excisionase family DNA binding protein